MLLLKWKNWPVIRIVFAIAGIFTISGIVLGFLVHQYFFYFSALVGLMQIIFSVLGFCPMMIFLRLLGLKCELDTK